MMDAASLQKLDAAPVDGLVPQRADEFLLLREMNHRLANTLTVLISVLRCDIELAASPSLQDALARLEKRILAFSRLHRSLIIGAANNWISVQYYVEHLCQALSDAVLEPLGVVCEVHVDAGELPSERCELLGLVIAELVTNAAKHAFGDRDDGVVRVELVRKADAWLCTVSDNGSGKSTETHGPGLKIVGQLVRTMGGHFARKSGPSGTSTAIICPIAEKSLA